MINVVVSRYNKNTDWTDKLKKFNVNLMIYDKENPNNPYNIPVNKGNEASVYLKYIIDNYDNLTEYTFFCHDEEFSWHHDGSIIDRFEEALQANKLFYNINHYNLEPYHYCVKDKNGYHDWYNKFIEPYIRFKNLPNKDITWGARGAAQFLLHKSLIQHLPLKFYKDLYDNCISDNSNPNVGYFFEWSWHIFWVLSPKYNLYDYYPNNLSNFYTFS